MVSMKDYSPQKARTAENVPGPREGKVEQGVCAMTKSLRTTVHFGVIVFISAVLLPHRTVAANNDNAEIISMLLKAGAEINARDEDGKTPLLAAATRDDPAVGLFLIKAGANVGAKDPNGSTPIVLAASQCGQTELVKALNKAGADVNANAAGGASARMMAEVMNCAETLKVLTAAGARK